MSNSVVNPDCPSPQLLDQLAESQELPTHVRDHLARCAACAEHLRNLRFQQRFAAVMAGTPLPIEPPADGASIPAVPGYRIESELSRGGQGVVYVATHLASNRRVAIKVLHPSRTDSPTSRARFTREIRIVAALNHPGIVRLLDSLSLSDGRDALIMELVRGVPLAQWLARSPRPDPREVVRVLADVAEAIHHAHAVGIIHRDLKPSNILIDEEGRARVLDFGVARWNDPGSSSDGAPPITETLRLTVTGEFTGTLAYAAPEQVSAQPARADTRSDVYSLGVIAYEAVGGRLPYTVSGSLETIISNILHAEPERLSRHEVTLDLWTIISKAMAKEPARRYQSAGDLARDLRRTLSGEAIDARRDSRLYVLRKSVRRHRFAVTLACLACAAAVAVLSILAVSNDRLSGALRESTIERIRTLAALGSRAKAEALLWPELQREVDAGADPEQRLWSAPFEQRRLLWTFIELQAPSPCNASIILPRGCPNRAESIDPNRIAIAYRDKPPSIFDMASRTEQVLPFALPDGVQFAGFTPGARHFLTFDGETLVCADAESGAPIAQRSLALPPRLNPADPLIDLAEGAVLISSRNGLIQGFSIPDLEPLPGLPMHTVPVDPWLDRAGRTFAHLQADGTLRIVDLTGAAPDRLVAALPPGAPAAPTGIDFVPTISVDPAFKHAVVGLHSATCIVAIDGDGPPRYLPGGPQYRAYSCLDPTGAFLMLGAFGDSRLRLWSTADWSERPALAGHDEAIPCFGVTADSSQIFTIDNSGVLRLWPVPDRGWRRALSPTPADPSAMALAPRAGSLYAAGEQSFLTAYPTDPDRGAPARVVAEAHANSVALSPDERSVAVAGLDGAITQIDLSTPGLPQRMLRPFESEGDRVQSLAFSPDGALLAACTFEGGLVTIDPAGGEVAGQTAIEGSKLAAITFTRDGAMLAVAARNGTLHLLEPRNLEPRRSIAASTQQLRAVECAPDSTSLAVVGDAGELILVDPHTGTHRASPRLSEDSLFAVSWHPSGRTLAVGDRAGVVVLVDAEALRPLATFSAGASVLTLRFDSSGALFVGALNRPIERWDFAALARTLSSLRPVNAP